MKKILTLDDFYLYYDRNVRRVMANPVWNYANTGADALTPGEAYYTSVIPGKDGGYYAYLQYNRDNVVPGDSSIAYSEDGLYFEPIPNAGWGGTVFLDEHDTDFPYKGLTNGGLSRAYESADFRSWTQIDGDEPVPGSPMDCLVSGMYNPHSRKYQVTLRRALGDRRISMVESEDLRTWSEPFCVLHSGTPLDAPGTHFYSMPVYYVRSMDIFVGFLWKLHMPYNRISNGPMTTELVYSYDGRIWNRTLHTLMPVNHPVCQADTAPADAPTGLSWLTGMVEREDDLLLYAATGNFEHHNGQLWNRHHMRTVVGKLRKDGFSYLQAGDDVGEAMTVSLKPTGEDTRLFLNYRTRGNGYVQVALCDIWGNAPDGFGFDDGIVPEGDFTKHELTWKGGTWKEFLKEKTWAKLKIRFKNADIFSLAGDFYAVVNTEGLLYERP